MLKNTLDLHTHSVLSKHAYSSVTENIDEALKKGLKFLGISEHQYDEYGVGAHYFGIGNLGIIPKQIGTLRILKGVELNILDGGKIDISMVPIKRLDYTIASMHRFAYDVNHSMEENTLAYQNICQLNYVKILGHIDRDGYPIDYRQVIEAAKLHGKIIELNNSSLVNDKDRHIFERDLMILDLCKEFKCPIIINSDAHIRYEIGNYEKAYQVIETNDFPHNLIMNFNHTLFKQYFGE